MKKCAYCGDKATDREHVFPRCLYPNSKSQSKVQRLTVPACSDCNNSWSDDEAHFRNIMILAGESNSVVYELWDNTLRSFDKIDGHKRLSDIFEAMKPVDIDGIKQHMVYPAKDEKVVRVMKKIIRGLSHRHNVLTVVPDTRIWVNVLQYQVPELFLKEMQYAHVEKDIVEYRFQILNDNEIQSAWIITFFERVTFVGIVSMAEEGWEIT